MTRDFETHPYSVDEKRVAEYIVRLTKGSIGAGDDPIGFLMASHEMMAADRAQRIKEMKIP